MRTGYKVMFEDTVNGRVERSLTAFSESEAKRWTSFLLRQAYLEAESPTLGDSIDGDSFEFPDEELLVDYVHGLGKTVYYTEMRTSDGPNG